MDRFMVRLDRRSHPVFVGAGLIPKLGTLLGDRLRGRRILVVADAHAWAHHETRLRRGLARLRPDVAVLPAGERTKSLTWVNRLYEECRKHRMDRHGVIIAFGGGVVGDLAGFVAASYLRGVDLVMVPTTLLSQVDSSIGGKVGINWGGIKNLVGAFHQPSAVVSDTMLLETLPLRELRSAVAEIIKYGMIARPGLLRLLERKADRVLSGDPGLLARLVGICGRIKARIVEEDERETGRRIILNYGHTLGHALESAARGRLRHGEAVALGMRGAADLGVQLGTLTASERERQNSLLDRFGLPATASGLDADEVLSKLKWDKKVRGRSPRFVLTRGIGSATVAQPINLVRLRRAVAVLLREKSLRRK